MTRNSFRLLEIRNVISSDEEKLPGLLVIFFTTFSSNRMERSVFSNFSSMRPQKMPIDISYTSRIQSINVGYKVIQENAKRCPMRSHIAQTLDSSIVTYSYALLTRFTRPPRPVLSSLRKVARGAMSE